MKRILAPLLITLLAPLALAKLPEVKLDDAAKAKAEETRAKAAWQAKVDAFQLCRSQDRVVSHYKKSGPKPQQSGTAAPATASAPANGPASANATAAASPATSTAGAAASTTAPAGSVVQTAGAPAAGGNIAPCVEPGPFAYTPPAERPLETSGAHSPAANPGSTPSVLPNSSQMNPAPK
ncbi:hypothetical protein JI739_07055 [Ramlibacter sp. AW1]|uniref:Uncharacterized protein n=1 Tax=Ramlibacter aurantiacus TaxID=2801330 RepID=A0A936ZH15_9BURK|nr:hypothetical protein [Ramlibacter aurantiacus]MBL0420103.1 hypothetical protein [Ramlibacter aurantiacus]